jgi:hypothetical protein
MVALGFESVLAGGVDPGSFAVAACGGLTGTGGEAGASTASGTSTDGDGGVAPVASAAGAVAPASEGSASGASADSPGGADASASLEPWAAASTDDSTLNSNVTALQAQSEQKRDRTSVRDTYHSVTLVAPESFGSGERSVPARSLAAPD